MTDTSLDTADPESIGQAAMAHLARRGLPPTPTLYAVWYHYYAGSDPDLTAAIEAQGGLDCLDRRASESLYGQYLGLRDEARELKKINQDLLRAIEAILEQLAQAGSDTSRYSEVLRAARQGLDAGAPEKVRELVDMLSRETKNLAARNADLEKQLRETATKVESLRESLAETQRASRLDGLTGLANRKSLNLMLASLVAAAESGESPCPDGYLAAIMVDIDHFKAFNDRYGHPMGDEVLKLCARVMARCLEEQHFLARYGGEEFMILAPGLDLPAATQLADRLRHHVGHKRIRYRGGRKDLGTVTLSAGVAMYSDGDTGDALMERGDRALYAAKRMGRDRVAYCDTNLLCHPGEDAMLV